MIITKGTIHSPQIEIMPLISITEMSAKLHKSRATIHRWVKARKLIAPVYQNNRTIGWCPIKFEQWQLAQK